MTFDLRSVDRFLWIVNEDTKPLVGTDVRENGLDRVALPPRRPFDL